MKWISWFVLWRIWKQWKFKNLNISLFNSQFSKSSYIIHSHCNFCIHTCTEGEGGGGTLIYSYQHWRLHYNTSRCFKNHFSYIGVAFDGYPIYGPLASWHNSGGSNLTTSDLDKCHGSSGSGSYRYYMTYDWPYILGCYKGKVIDTRVSRDVTYSCSNSSTSCKYFWII